ncbi:hypothetical protein, partial [Mycolicibacterium holsaticum]|uniref:hypothetical protein n=1 Tax=Mycolicibacterium holsaticum TaxID=152142 RepID=UPI0013F4E039
MSSPRRSWSSVSSSWSAGSWWWLSWSWSLKPFGMAYTRLETRSAYHFGYGPRTGQLVARAVFDSDFVQQRY